MDQVLEHVIDPLKTIQEIYRVLKPSGKLIVATPNPYAFGRYFFGRYWGGWHLPYHQHFYSQRSTNILAEKAGYEVVSMKSATESAYLLYTWARLFVLGAKGKPAPQYSVTSDGKNFDPAMTKRLDSQIFLFAKKSRLFSLPMRIADLFGAGDWNLLILEKRQ